MRLQIAVGLLLIGLMLSCSANEQKMSVLKDEESAYNESPSQNTASQLNAAIINHIRAHPELDLKSQNQLLERGYEVSKEQNMLQESVNFLNTMIRNEREADVINSRSQELINLLDKMNNKEASNTLKLAYKKAFPKSSSNVNFAVNSDMEFDNLDDKINRLAASMFDDSTHQFNTGIASRFIDACEAHALLMPSESKSLEYLHKAGETARSIRSFRKAVAIYDWLYTKYPNDGRASQALFLKAFTFDNDLKDLEIAGNLYQEYLDKFPNEDFADDTRFLLDNLGKSDEEILQELNKKENQ